MKSLDAYWVAHFLRLHREKRALDRDVILALTADEEAGDENGVEWLLAHAPELIRAAYALNEGGGGELKSGRRRANDVQASEKGYFSFRFEVRNKGGHSSLPERDNAIVRLGRALIAVHDYEFDARLDAGDASLLRAAGGARDRRGRGGSASACVDRGGQAARPRRRDAPVAAAVLQRAPAHDLRADARAGRARRQRAPAAGDGGRELPPASRRFRRRRPPRAGARDRRRRRQRRAHGTRRHRPRLAASARALPGGRRR